VANQVVFDDVTFGGATPGGDDRVVPEPATLGLLSLGLVAGAYAARRRRRA